MSHLRTAVLLLLLPNAACDRSPGGVATLDTERITADGEPGNWLSHGRTYSEQRFSPLTAIDTATVATLGLAWSYPLRTARGASATPLVVDGVMYLTSSWSIVYALDARTGAERWVFDPEVDRRVGAKACCDVINRGVAAYDGRIYVGAIDGRLIALDAGTGERVWETMTVDSTLPYTISGAPRAAQGLVFIGNGGAEYGVRGYVSAYDAATGNLAWRFYTVPGDPAVADGAASDAAMAAAAATWTGEWWQLGGGGTVWDAIVYDPDFDQLLIGVGNGSPWNRQVRSPGGGDNLYLSSIVALDATTGRYKWHYQTTPGDTWDYTATQPIILADLTIGGSVRKVAMQAPKNGFFYVLDRATGALVSAEPIFPMLPTAATPPGVPISWAYAIDSATGRPVENPEARYIDQPATVRPSPMGVHNWHPMSYSPRTGLVYIPVQDMAGSFATDPGFVARAGTWNTGTAPAPYPDNAVVRAMIRMGNRGELVAWDPVTRKAAWRVQRPHPWNGGTLATAGELVFEGTIEGRFVAHHARTGAELWSTSGLLPMLAGPISYAVDGEQYVAGLGGYGSAGLILGAVFGPEARPETPGRLYVFKLGGTAPTPDLPARTPAPEPPVVPMSEAGYAQGALLFSAYCFSCHGIAAIGGGVLPDLRSSARLADSGAWHRAVRQGELHNRGMADLRQYLTDADAELLRAYVARQAAMRFQAERGRTP